MQIKQRLSYEKTQFYKHTIKLIILICTATISTSCNTTKGFKNFQSKDVVVDISEMKARKISEQGAVLSVYKIDDGRIAISYLRSIHGKIYCQLKDIADAVIIPENEINRLVNTLVKIIQEYRREEIDENVTIDYCLYENRNKTETIQEAAHDRMLLRQTISIPTIHLAFRLQYNHSIAIPRNVKEIVFYQPRRAHTQTTYIEIHDLECLLATINALSGKHN